MHSENWTLTTIPDIDVGGGKGVSQGTGDPGFLWYQNAANDTSNDLESVSFGTGPQTMTSGSSSTGTSSTASSSSFASGSSVMTTTGTATKSGFTVTSTESVTGTSSLSSHSATSSSAAGLSRDVSMAASALALVAGAFVHFG